MAWPTEWKKARLMWCIEVRSLVEVEIKRQSQFHMVKASLFHEISQSHALKINGVDVYSARWLISVANTSNDLYRRSIPTQQAPARALSSCAHCGPYDAQSTSHKFDSLAASPPCAYAYEPPCGSSCGIAFHTRCNCVAFHRNAPADVCWASCATGTASHTPHIRAVSLVCG